MSASDNSSVKKKFNWLGASAWGAGSAIFGWLLAGLCYQRDYRNLTTGDLLCAILATVLGVVIALVSLWLIKGGHKKSAESSTDTNTPETLSEIIAGVLPAIFFILSLSTLVLTFSTYNGDWKDARQGLATGFAALIAAAGAIISVNVTYKISEENRAAQKEIEDNKRDADTIKSLNDRLHNILDRRNNEDEKERISSYFQLGALYKDWELLSKNSKNINTQKQNSQNYILNIIFGIGESDSSKKNSCQRRPGEVKALKSVVRDLFPRISAAEVYEIDCGGKHDYPNDKVEDARYNLEYLDLSGVDFLRRDLRGSRLSEANLSEVNLTCVDLSDSNLRGVDFTGANLSYAKFVQCKIDGAKLGDVKRMDDILFYCIESENITTIEVQDRIVEELKKAKTLPAKNILLKAKDFDGKLVDRIIEEWKKWNEAHS